jgi:hypothetical protein
MLSLAVSVGSREKLIGIIARVGRGNANGAYGDSVREVLTAPLPMPEFGGNPIFPKIWNLRRSGNQGAALPNNKLGSQNRFFLTVLILQE